MKLLLFNNHRKILSNTCKKLCTNTGLKPPWDVLFFGTDKFSLESLQTLHREKLNSSQIIRNLEVVTNKKNSFVKKYAEDNSIPIQHWPLETPTECCQRFHIGVVVSFGNLIPKAIIEAFPLGMINVHASLLPRWRGAAPIIHALAAGDQKTGVTIMKIQPHHFDIGEIIHQEEIAISEDVRMPQLHSQLAKIGADNLLEVLKKSPSILSQARKQNSEVVTFAPRVNSTMANINFLEHTAQDMYNLGRALTGLYPLVVQHHDKIIKLHNIVKYTHLQHSIAIGTVKYDRSTKLLMISTRNGWIFVDKIGVPGKKIMNALEFRNGYLKNSDIVLSSV